MSKRREKKATWEDILEVGRSFWPSEPGEPPAPATGYARGQMELLGRILLDVFGEGEGTAENACELAERLNVSPMFYEPAHRKDLVTLWSTAPRGEPDRYDRPLSTDRDVVRTNATHRDRDVVRVTLEVVRVEKEE